MLGSARPLPLHSASCCCAATSRVSQILSNEGRLAGRLLQQLFNNLPIAGGQSFAMGGPSPLYLAPSIWSSARASSEKRGPGIAGERRGG